MRTSVRHQLGKASGAACLALILSGAATASPRGFVKSTLALDAPAVALAFDSDGALYVMEEADFGTNVATLRTFPADGSPGDGYPVSGDAATFFIGGMAWDGFDPLNQRLLISDNSVAADGRLYAVSIDGVRDPQPITAGIAGIADIAVRSTGEIFVSTAPIGEAGAVLQIDRQSGASSVVLSGLGFGAGLEFDLAGHLIVQDSSTAMFPGRLQRLTITDTPAGIEFGPEATLLDDMQSGYGVAVDSEGDFFTTGSGGLFLAKTPFDGDPFDFATAIAFDPGARPFEPFAGPDGGLLVYTANFGDTFVTLLTPAQPGDYNADGSVDADDYTSWQSAYGSTTELAADGNGDNVIDAADYVIWRKNVSDLASSSSSNAAAVPEPASVLMLIGLALSAVQVRLRPLKK